MFRKQFWTTRGFAVADLDYAGSTGLGRATTGDWPDGQWGEADLDDTCALWPTTSSQRHWPTRPAWPCAAAARADSPVLGRVGAP